VHQAHCLYSKTCLKQTAAIPRYPDKIADESQFYDAGLVPYFGTLSVCENTNDNTEYAICVNDNNDKISVKYSGYDSVILTI